MTGSSIRRDAVAGASAHAQSYPTRPIRYHPVRRAAAPATWSAASCSTQMSQSLGQPIVVENNRRSGNSSTQLAAKAAPDGYTLSARAPPDRSQSRAVPDLGYDPLKELTIISPFASFTIVVTASNKLGITSVKELIERAKKEPAALNYGSVGIGSSQHLAGEYFAQVTGVKMTHVPYKNIGQYGPDLISGQVQLGFQWYPNVAGPINAKGARRGRAGDVRLAAMPTRRPRKRAGAQYKVEAVRVRRPPAFRRRHGTAQQELHAALADPAVKS